MRRLIILMSCLAAFVLMLGSNAVFAQGVTTSAIEGQVFTYANLPLANANVVAIHEPSGTRYGTVTRDDGRFNLPNLRTGGPYTVTVSFVGYETDRITDLRLALGESRTLIFMLPESGMVLEEVIVLGAIDPVMNADRTGAATNLNVDNIQRMPTISRTIEDFTRMSPLSNGSSFAGRDNRFNNYTVDGNIYNNNFGLGSGQFAATNPISMEAIEEIQINIAPFDVRQGGFTGANVNAITRSGTNEFRGSVYTFFRNEYMIGRKIGDDSFNVDEALTNIYGVSVGGPIIRDRLFFFVSVEQEESSVPGDSRLAARPGLSGPNVTRVQADHMDFVRQQMMNIYDYETGPYENYPFANEALRLNFRLDYNINPNHRASIRYNRYSAFRDVTINGNSVRNLTRYTNTNRFGMDALTFRNANYSVDNNVNSFVAELNSVFGNRFANNLNIGYTFIEDPKRSVPGGQTFPFVEVLEWDGPKPGDVDGDGNPMPLGTPLYYFALGNELFTVGNLLQNQIINITNNFSAFMGRHTLTAGFNFEYMTFENAFNPNAHTFYRFNSYQNFLDVVINRVPGAVPDGFAMSYSYEGPDDLPMDETAFGQFGIYVQDKFQVNPDLVVTAGLRVDLPFFPFDPPNNPRLDEIFAEEHNRFTDPSNPDRKIAPDVSQMPGVKPLISPRLSFNYDVFGDNSLRLRGGTGFFSGRIPFVWISNQISANGVTRGFTGWDRWVLRTDADGNEYWHENQWGTAGRPNWEGFSPDPATYKPTGDDLEAQVSRDINITDPDFRFPQVWRTNIAADYRLPFDIIGTLEGIYSSDFNSPLAQNINLAAPAGTFSGVDQRPYFTSYTEVSNYIVNGENVGSANEIMLLTNTNQGYYWSITAQLQKDFENGLFASVAYTRGVSRDYGLIGGSQAASLWPNVVKEDRNNPEMGYSRFDQPNRFVAFLSFDTRALSARNTSSFSLFYTGGEGGRFSYVYAGNFGDRAARLMYIPKDASEINLIPTTVGGEELTPAQQWNILNAFIEQDDYLNNNRGSIAERNGALLPWVHRFDFRFTQDINLTQLPDRHKLQITFDILNVGNMINSEWGVGNTVWQSAPLVYRGRNTDTNQPEYSINVPSGLNSLPGAGPELEQAFRENSYRRLVNINQTWRLQVGVRYLL
ncbi:MAG: carboxypeptidase-like regulatory domain-containing protein [Bacteroidales bacterium]|nr:carboxypeptidase-like regulatory domain-containing protein [Bacteroidales bacterium]